MLAAIVGPMGAGKTCFMTYLLYRDHKERGRTVMANYGLKFPHEPLEIDRLLDATDKVLQDAAIGIDEAWLFFDSRAAMKSRNRLISQVLLQSRKRGVDVYVTAQSFKQIDVRFRQNCDYVILVNMRNDAMFARIFNRDTGRWTKIVVYAKPVYSLYDTNELVDPLVKIEHVTTDRPQKAKKAA